MRVKAAVCPAAHWSVSFNLHGIQQVLITEARRPANVKLSLPDAAGTGVMELRVRARRQKKQ